VVAAIHDPALRPKERPIRVAVVADVRLHGEGLARILSRTSTVEILAVTSIGERDLAEVAELDPDVVLLDVAPPDARDAVREINELADPPLVVAVGIPDPAREAPSHVDLETVLGLAEAGVAAYLTRSADGERLVATVTSVVHAEFACSPHVAAVLLRRVHELASHPVPPGVAQLTRRESEVFGLLQEGLTNKEIAARLYISNATVKNHVHHILGKLELERRTDPGILVRSWAGPY
jgi:DNA-binding NarL/FixJ family response regulator